MSGDQVAWTFWVRAAPAQRVGGTCRGDGAPALIC